MKIGILTHYYKSANYGGNLQAYALCKVLEELGHAPQQVQIDLSKDYRNLLNPKSFRQKLKELVRPVVRLLIPSYRKKWQKKESTKRRLEQAFSHFNRQLIPHSEAVYTPKTVKNTLPLYDAFITGSDQVWNPIWYFPPFFLDFVPSDKPKLSYAASIGQSKLPESVQTLYRKHLQDFIGVSVREQDAVALLDGKAQWVLDPTLLLSRQQWQAVTKAPDIQKNYVFCYFLGNDGESRKLAADYAKTKGLSLVTIPNATGLENSNDADFGDIRLDDPTPEAFLGLIAGAEYVFTDSFHATVFSLIFGRQFVTFPRQGQGSSRITSLTELFDTESRFCDSRERQSLSYLEALPAYEPLPEKFARAVAESRAYLQTTLEKAKEMLK